MLKKLFGLSVVAVMMLFFGFGAVAGAQEAEIECEEGEVAVEGEVEGEFECELEAEAEAEGEGEVEGAEEGGAADGAAPVGGVATGVGGTASTDGAAQSPTVLWVVALVALAGMAFTGHQMRRTSAKS